MLRDDGTDRGDGRRTSRNVLGEPLAICSLKRMTGFYRDGCCDTGREDVGSHTVCAVMTSEFLEFSKSRGNDLSTPVPEFGFPGLKPGDRWCLCAPRWQEAFEANQAPRVVLRDLEHFHPARPVLGAQSGERLGDEVIALCLHVEESRRHEHPHRALSSSNAVPPPARSDPQAEPHSEPVHIAPRSSSPALRRFEAKGHPLPDFYSGATAIPGRFSEGLLLRRSHALCDQQRREQRRKDNFACLDISH